MKKIVLWSMSTLTVLVLLFGYHTSTSSRAATAGGESSVAAPVTGAAGTTAGGSGTGTSDGTSTDGTSTDGTSTGGPASPSSSSSAAGGTTSTVTGDVADTRWGPVEVQLTVRNRKITNVSVVEYPDNNGRDQEINAQALPVLIQETLSAQSAQIDMVSGATVTSEGYLSSLQSALDKAGL